METKYSNSKFFDKALTQTIEWFKKIEINLKIMQDILYEFIKKLKIFD